MILLQGFLKTTTTLQKFEYRILTAARKQLFYTYLTPSIRSSRKPCLLSTLRYRGTDAFQAKPFNYTARPAARAKRSSDFKNLIILAAPEKWRLLGAIAFLLVSSTVTMAVPFCLGKLIDVIYSSDKENMRENLNRLCAIFLGVFVLGGICNYGRVYLMSTTGHRITQSLRKQLYAAILRQETAMFDKCKTGELVGRISGMYLILVLSYAKGLPHPPVLYIDFRRYAAY